MLLLLLRGRCCRLWQGGAAVIHKKSEHRTAQKEEEDEGRGGRNPHSSSTTTTTHAIHVPLRWQQGGSKNSDGQILGRIKMRTSHIAEITITVARESLTELWRQKFNFRSLFYVSKLCVNKVATLDRIISRFAIWKPQLSHLLTKEDEANFGLDACKGCYTSYSNGACIMLYICCNTLFNVNSGTT